MFKEFLELSIYISGTCLGFYIGYSMIKGINKNNKENDNKSLNSNDLDLVYFTDEELNKVDEALLNILECRIDTSKLIKIKLFF